METYRISVEGMSCQHCVERLRAALDTVDGLDVRDVRVGEADLAFDPSRVRMDAILSAVSSAGYSAT